MSERGLSSQQQAHGAAPRGHGHTLGKLNEQTSSANPGGFLQPSITSTGTASEQQKKARLLQKLIKDQAVMKQKLLNSSFKDKQTLSHR